MPAAVESIAKLGAVLVHLPQAPASHIIFEPNDDVGHIGGRSSTVGLLPAVQKGHHAPSHNALPQVQSYASLIGLLRPALPDIASALQKVLPANQKNLEVLGVGTEAGIIAVLIGLLRTHGYHATIASCDGSVRPGFSGPTAVLRARGNSTCGVFLQQVASAVAGSAYGQ